MLIERAYIVTSKFNISRSDKKNKFNLIIYITSEKRNRKTVTLYKQITHKKTITILNSLIGR